MFDNLKIPVDKFLYEKINSLGLLFYLYIMIVYFVVFSINFIICEKPSDLYAPLVILLSVTIIFIQMNYNIYDSKLKKEEELNLKTMEILKNTYMNTNNFSEEETKFLEEFKILQILIFL